MYSRRAAAHRWLMPLGSLLLILLSVAPAAASEAPDSRVEQQGLPDAPAPVVPTEVAWSSSFDGEPAWMTSQPEWMRQPVASGAIQPQKGYAIVPLEQCPFDTEGARSCRVHWRQLLISSAVFNAFQNGGNLYTGYWYRKETLRGKWLQRYFNSVLGWRWGQWTDGNPFLDVYVGHPIMGSLTSYLWIQNDPKGMTLEFSNTRPYWKSRMRALAYSTAYSFEWKFGPFGEAGVGHNGDHLTVFVDGKRQNDTGVVELVTTPVGGFLWTLGEDAIDTKIVKRIESKPRNAFTLLAISFLTPTRGAANILRFRPPWYRDSRVVKTSSFWSDPVTAETASNFAPEADVKVAPGDVVKRATIAQVRQPLPEWPHYGGVHEFGAWWGLSLMSGHLWGDAKDVKYMPIDVNYSYLLHQGRGWQFRYAPELTALAMLDEINPNKQADRYNKRIRTYGSGLSPLGWRANFRTDSAVQPYLSGAGGFLYFGDRVLSPQGSQWMYTVDYGAGLQVFRKARQSVSIGYRYQYLSNGNISRHNPGTDTNVFYVAVSRFRSKGYR